MRERNQRAYPRSNSVVRDGVQTPSRFEEFCQNVGKRPSLFFRIFPQLRGQWDLKLWGGIFLFSVLLSWLLTVDLESFHHLKVGDQASQNVISPFSFEMIDDVSTDDERARAESSVPPIFDFDPQAFDHVSNRVYRAFRILRSEFREVQWPKNEADREERIKDFSSHKGEFEKELGTEISEYLYEWTLRQELNARLETAIIKNLEFWYNKKLVDAVDRNVPFDTSQVLVKTLYHENNKEFFLKRSDLTNLSDPEAITLVNDGHLFVKDQKNLLDMVRTLLIPNMTLNRNEMETRRAKLRDTILPISVSIKKNQLIITEGNTVQPQQFSIVQQIAKLKKERSSVSVLLSLSLLFFFLILVLFVFVKTNFLARMSVRDLWALGSVTILTVIIFKIFVFLTQTSLAARFGSWIPTEVFFFATPVAVGSMLAGLLFPAREVVFLFTAFLSFVLGVATEFNFQYMVVSFIGGLVAARSVGHVRTRSDLYAAGFKTGIINAVVIALLVTASKTNQELFWAELGWSIPAGLIGGVLSSFLALVFVSFFESVFHFATNIKLLELSNLNHPLLREMIVKAPGTYHHSMMVGSMVEAAAEEIGANPLLSKVMAYYHDIGKVEHANYFIENQKPGQNPHDHISPYMSKTLLVAHMKDGMELAAKFKLGTAIIDGIVQHHGTTVIAFFYNRARDQAPVADAVLEGEFRYPGPKPQFREAALIMLADSIEAAARSLDEPTPQRLQHIVRAVVQRKFMDGQLDECNISMKDLNQIENAFTRILLGIYHQRIDYPKAMA